MVDVVDQGFAPLPAQVDVDIREIAAVRMEEALKAKLMANRVDLGDPESIGDDGSSARSATGTGDAEASGFIDDLPDDEKVRDETHFVDDLQLAGQTFEHGSLNFAVAAKQSLMAALIELTVCGLITDFFDGWKDGGGWFCGIGMGVLAEEFGSGDGFGKIAVALTPFVNAGNRQ